MTRRTQACDGCRLRKVKCHGRRPCTQCAHLNLACVFSEPSTRRTPHIRGRLVAQLRGRHRSNTSVGQLLRHFEAPAVACRPRGFFLSLLPQFSEFVYPLNPILSAQEVREAIEQMDCSAEDAALVHAFAAITINRVRSAWGPHGEDAALMTDLIYGGMRAYRAAELDSDDFRDGVLGPLPVSIKRVLTAIFLSVCVMNLGCLTRGFALLRDAIAILQTYDFQHRSRDPSGQDTCKWQRLSWQAYIHERHLAFMPSFRPILNAHGRPPPMADPNIPPHIDLGFRRLANLFLVLDDTFVDCLCAQRDSTLESPELTAEWLERKEAQLDEDAVGTAEEERCLRERGLDGLTELQDMDLSITRLWLRTLVWQLALSRGHLCSIPSHDGLSLHFPSKTLCNELKSLFARLGHITSIGCQGMGMLQKLFEITSTIADVLILLVRREHACEETFSPVQDMVFLIELLMGFTSMPHQQREYLSDKLQVLQVLKAAENFEDPFLPRNYQLSDSTVGMSLKD